MTSSCPIRRVYASEFAIAARQFAEAAVVLATLGTSGIDYTRLRDRTIEAQARSESALKAFIEQVVSHQCGEATLNGHEHPCAQLAEL
jgi:hypothetical protein